MDCTFTPKTSTPGVFNEKGLVDRLNKPKLKNESKKVDD